MADLSFSELALLTQGDVKNLALACKKSCDLDPLPSSILSIHLDHLLPVITKMTNLSPKTGRFADEWKNALVHPLLKKSGLEPVNKNFRPISIYSLLLSLQRKWLLSSYRPICWPMACSRKCRVRIVSITQLRRRYWQSRTIFCDTVDHDILIHRLQSLLGLRGSALQWFRPYLRGRSQLTRDN